MGNRKKYNDNEILKGWEEIGEYLKVHPTTAMKWYNKWGLPIFHYPGRQVATYVGLIKDWIIKANRYEKRPHVEYKDIPDDKEWLDLLPCKRQPKTLKERIEKEVEITLISLKHNKIYFWQAQKNLGVGRKTLYRWIKKYDKDGMEGINFKISMAETEREDGFLEEIEDIKPNVIEPLNSREAIYGFVGWLLCRSGEKMVFVPSKNDVVTNFVEQFCEINKLPKTSERWSEKLIHPSGKINYLEGG